MNVFYIILFLQFEEVEALIKSSQNNILSLKDVVWDSSGKFVAFCANDMIQVFRIDESVRPTQVRSKSFIYKP